MINKSVILDLIEEGLADTGIFLVELKLSTSNQITIFIDKNEGIKIEDCINLSKFIESKLDREADDFELQVSSPGMDHPFKVKEQFLKNLGKEIKIYTFDGRKHQGFLKEYDEEKLIITFEVKQKIEGRKKKELVNKIETYYFNSDQPENKIKETKKVFSFKF